MTTTTNTEFINIDLPETKQARERDDIKMTTKLYTLHTISFADVVEAGYLSQVEYFIEMGANVNHIVTKNNLKVMSVLSLAIYNNNFPVMKCLLDNGADVETIDITGNTPLLLACNHNSLEMVKYLVEVGGADIDVKDKNGNTPLLLACKNNNLEMVKYLVEVGGTDIDAKDNYINALWWACKNNKLEIVKYLLDNGADVETIDITGNTPLLVACKNNKLEIVKYLVETGGADIDVKDNNGDTPLIFTCYAGNLEIVKYLVEAGADVDAKYNKGNALWWACKNNKLEIVKYLVEAGADIDVKDNYGNALWIQEYLKKSKIHFASTIPPNVSRGASVAGMNIETPFEEFHCHNRREKNCNIL
jgi:ankyrin repeat protein